MKKGIRAVFIITSICVGSGILVGCGQNHGFVVLESVQMEETSGGTLEKPEGTEAPATEAPTAESTTVPPATQATKEPLSEEELAEFDAENYLAREAYKEALSTILTELKLPDGEELYYDGFHEFSENRFAIADVDGDYREELIFDYTTGPMGAMALYVYGYDVEKDEFHLELKKFPGASFYDNGIVIERASHNHGRGEQLWPYAVYYYSEVTDDYRFGVNVDSWEKAYYGEKVRDEVFPTMVDEDGDGIVYYRMDEEFQYENPLDGPEYEAWYEGLLKGATLVKPEYRAMNKQNIEAINQENNKDLTILPGEGDGVEWYVDRQGSTDIYSDLQIKYLEEGVYSATIGIYRLTTLEGKAVLQGEVLMFEDAEFGVKGEIRIEGTKAVFVVTESKFMYMNVGDTFEFPDKL